MLPEVEGCHHQPQARDLLFAASNKTLLLPAESRSLALLVMTIF